MGKKSKLKTAPFLAIQTGAENGSKVAADYASEGRRVLRIGHGKHDGPTVVNVRQVFAVCEADIYSKAGRSKVDQMLSDQVFDTLVFCVQPNDEESEELYLDGFWNGTQQEVIKHAMMQWLFHSSGMMTISG